MTRRPLKRFLLSMDAIQVHLLCLGLIALLSFSIWSGDAQPDYKWGLLFTILIYPALLGFLWWNDRLEEQAAIEHIVESLTEPTRLRKKRQKWRRGALIFLFAASVALVFAGHRGFEIEMLPAQYLGYFLFAVCGLGVTGVNIWHGGPLDPRMDPPLEETGRLDVLPDEFGSSK